MKESFDAVVIGGGPGGSSAATTIARAGGRILVLERTHFPRFAIGESLIPQVYRVLELLGCLDKVKSEGFSRKHGFNFLSQSGRLTPPYFFSQSMKDPKAATWSVERDRFDQLLLEHSESCGADVRFGCKVTEVFFDDGAVVGLSYKDDDGKEHEVSSRVVVDASGRGCILARQMGLVERDPVLNQIALWRYVSGAVRQVGQSEGNIVIALHKPHGWTWWIPMSNDVTSVGVVGTREWLSTHGDRPHEQFDSCIQSNPLLSEWTEKSEWMTDTSAVGDYSYSSSRLAGRGFVLVGDAGGFIDPVFSSGVWMAMSSGYLAGQAVADGLAGEGYMPAEAFNDYTTWYRRGFATFRIFLDAFYDDNFSANYFFKHHSEWIPEWGRVLQGDVFGDNRAFNEFLMNLRRDLAAARDEDVHILSPPGWAEDHHALEGERLSCPFGLQRVSA